MKITDHLSQIRVEGLGGRALGFWRWWTSELVAIVPQNIRKKLQELFRDNTGAVTVDVAEKMVVVSRTAGGVTSEILHASKEDLSSSRHKRRRQNRKAGNKWWRQGHRACAARRIAAPDGQAARRRQP